MVTHCVDCGKRTGDFMAENGHRATEVIAKCVGCGKEWCTECRNGADVAPLPDWPNPDFLCFKIPAGTVPFDPAVATLWQVTCGPCRETPPGQAIRCRKCGSIVIGTCRILCRCPDHDSTVPDPKRCRTTYCAKGCVDVIRAPVKISQPEAIVSIGEFCFESFPCQHRVVVRDRDWNDTSKMMSGPRIIEMVHKQDDWVWGIDNLSVPAHLVRAKSEQSRPVEKSGWFSFKRRTSVGTLKNAADYSNQTKE